MILSATHREKTLLNRLDGAKKLQNMVKNINKFTSGLSLKNNVII